MMDRWITLNGYYHMDNLVLGGRIYFLLLTLDPGDSASAVSPADLKHIQSASFIDLKWVDS
jgi:hypothetical protein